ncbi:MAG: hypothetical protein KAJ19_18280, partial [Gammaproteobacteria bacterium]|nr:hypothetical protein [Gammaproteobacteria bacterium]
MKNINYVCILSIVTAAIIFGGCVRDCSCGCGCVRCRSTDFLGNKVVCLEKQLEEVECEHARLIAERERLDGSIVEAKLLSERAAYILAEKIRLEE